MYPCDVVFQSAAVYSRESPVPTSVYVVLPMTALLLLHGQVGAAGFLDVMAAAYLAEHSNPSLDLGTSVAVLGATTAPVYFRRSVSAR